MLYIYKMDCKSKPNNSSARYFQFIKGFYFLNIFFVVSSIVNRAHEWVAFRPELVEIMFWFKWLPFPTAEVALMVSAVLIHALALLWTRVQSVRIITFVISIIFYGRFNNYDHIDHNYYFILYPLFFAALPRFMTPQNLAVTAKFCLVAVFFPFTLAGLNKVIYGLCYLVLGQERGAFSSIYAFHRMIGKEAPLLPATSALGLWTLQYPVITYICYLGAVIMQVVSAFVAWRGRHLVLLGLFFAVFQIGTWFFMTIYFQEAMLVIAYAAFMYPSDERLQEGEITGIAGSRLRALKS